MERGYTIQPAPVGGSRLVADYLEGGAAAASFFGGDPFDLSSFRLKLEEVSRRFGPGERAAAARAVRPTSENARVRLERFVREGGAMVTTGQQAGFLTGPLYTINKALSAVVLARHLEESLGVVVLPLFWAATEDHDWAEANHAYLLDHRDRLERFELPGSGDDRPALPMAATPLGAGVESILEEVSHVLGDAGDSKRCIRSILDAYRSPGQTVGGAFVEAMTGILGGWDALIADAADPALKRASRATMEKALTDAEAQEHALQARSRELLEAGYGTQVSVLDRGVNLFLHGAAGRERLYRRGGDFVVRERAGILERESLLERLQREPGAFSPNVLLRPVVESAVFPTLAYVGGPGEINYFAQASSLFGSFGIAPPIVVPRFAATVREARVERLLADIGLSEGDLVAPREVLRDRIARREIPPSLVSQLEEIRRAWTAGFQELIEEAEALDPTLVGSLGGIRNRGLLAGERAERKIVRALKRRNLAPFEQLDRVLNSLRPLGEPQDRVLSGATYLARFDDRFLRTVVAAIEEHWRLPI